MKKVFMVVVLIGVASLLFVLTGCGGGGGGGGTTSPTDTDLISGIITNMSSSINAEKVTEHMSNISQNYFDSDGLTYTSYQKQLEDFFANCSNISLTVKVNSITVNNLTATVDLTYSGNANNDKTGESIDLSAHYIDTFTKEAGVWKLTFSQDTSVGSISGKIISPLTSIARIIPLKKQEIPPIHPKGIIEKTSGRIMGRKVSLIKNNIAEPCSGKDFKLGEVIVKLNNPADIKDFPKKVNMNLKSSDPDGLLLLKLNPNELNLSEDEIKKETINKCLELNHRVDTKYANLNYKVYSSATTPNDSYYGYQWHYNAINLPEAWDITTGSDNIIVAVIDTGIVLHPDLDSRVIAGYDFISDPESANDGDGVDSNPFDDMSGISNLMMCGENKCHSHYHGTHVAGTIGAVTNNNHGVAGVTWNTKIMPIRVLGIGGSGSAYDIVQGIKYAAGLPNVSGTIPSKKANIINMSLGGQMSCPQEYQDAINAAVNAGVFVVAAAGNDYSNIIGTPANCDNVMSVGAVGRNLKKTDYSNYGENLDIAAPGGNSGDCIIFNCGIYSTLVNYSTLGENYVALDGTSMASPHVAGLSALMLSVNPSLLPEDMASIIINTATDLGTPGKDIYYGNGLINAYKAVIQAQGTANPPILAVTPDSLDFGNSDTQLYVYAYNNGGGTLNINNPTESEVSGGNWLSITSEIVSNIMSITATVDRTGLSAGTYTGNIYITSDGGNITIPVSIEVGGATMEDIGTVYVLAIPPDASETEFWGETDFSKKYEYKVYGIDAANYLVIAGTDKDNDDEVCEEDDACGIYPMLDTPDVVSVAAMQNSPDIDFIVSTYSIESGRKIGTYENYKKYAIPKNGIKLKTEKKKFK